MVNLKEIFYIGFTEIMWHKKSDFFTISAKAYYDIGIKSSLFKFILTNMGFFKVYFLRFGYGR